MIESDVKKDNEKQTTGTPFVEFVTTIVKYRYFLFIFIFGISFIATAYALLAPKWYKSTAAVLPAEQTDLLGGLSGLSSLVKGFSASSGLASLTGGNESDRYLAILQSSRVIDNVINKFNIRDVYEMEDDYYEKVVKALKNNVEMEIQDEGQLTITVYDEEPQRAADMANYFVDQLNEVNTQLHVQNAKANREFVEHRYKQNIADIDSLETAMTNFQQEYGVIAVPEQIETTVAAMASIYGQLAEQELKLSVLQETLSPSHPMVTMAKTQAEQLKKKIREMNKGDMVEEGDVNLLIPFKKAPELASKYLKIYRDLEIQYKILEFITPLYEQAKVEEVRNTPSVVVLDKAGPAERKAKPKGTIYLLVSFVVSSLLGLLIVFTRELVEKVKRTAPRNYNFVYSSLESDWEKIKSKFRKKGNS